MKKTKIIKLVRNVIIVAIALSIALFILKIAPNYKNEEITDRTNLVINNNNVTSHLKNKVLIEDSVIYISRADIYNFFDPYIYYDKEESQIITSYGTKIASLFLNKSSATINGKEYTLSAPAITNNDVVYIPFSLLTNVYNSEIKYVEKTNTVVIETLTKEKITATAKNNLSIKSRSHILSKTVDKVKKSEILTVISTNKGWARVLTDNGKIGYVQENKLLDKKTIRESVNTDLKVEGKINMFWDNFYVSAPNRNGTTIPGVNVVSPTFFELERNGNGNIIDIVGSSGLEYIKWAKSNNYKVWALVGNRSENMIQTTSNIMNSYKLRSKLIENIVNAAVKYELDGINIDFEYMYDKDINLFTQFLVELHPRLKEHNIILSVDVTAPDGGENWSTCYDRDAIADNCDYIVFMAYDQYGSSSKKSGTTAGYDWMKVSLNKFLKTEEISPSKIILGLPFFTRIWEENSADKVSSNVVDMKNVERNLPNGSEKKWLEDVRQYYVEYQKDGSTYKMWIEDERSLREKLSLVTENDLAGVSFWAKDRETQSIWNVIDEILNNK